MRMLLKAQADTLSSNPKIKDGSLGNDINSILADTKPEAVYFYLENGRRTAQVISTYKTSLIYQLLSNHGYWHLGLMSRLLRY